MARIVQTFQSFNRGIISGLALARADIDRVGISAELQTNWMPRALGSMMLRPGMSIEEGTNGNTEALYIPFVFSATDKALIELTNATMRVLVDTVLVTRNSTSATVTNGTFNSDLTGWTDADDLGATSAWLTGGYMSLTGSGFAQAKRYQTVVISNSGTSRALRVVVTTGEVMIRIGSSVGGQQFLEETTIKEGTHSLVFTPNANFTIQVSARSRYATLIDSIAIEAGGTFTIPTPWATADLVNVRYEQSADVIFIACRNYQQYRIERRSNNSWSVVKYAPTDGPFRASNTTLVSITASATYGDVTLTASQDIFTSANVGSLYKLESTGQSVVANLTGADQFSDSIIVTGFGSTERNFSWAITGTWSGEVTAQYSIGIEGSWVDSFSRTFNDADASYDDSLDDQTVYWRFGFKTGDYTSGTATITLVYPRGSKIGVAKVTAYSSATSVTAQVLDPLGNVSSTQLWSEGAWSNRRGWPSAVALFEGRMWWAGMDRLWGSASDAFESYDAEIEGDSKPISRSIGSGPVETIQWLLPLQRLLVGGQGAEFSVRSSSFDEPITASNFGIKPASTQGSAGVPAIRVDASGFFIQRGGARLYEMSFSTGYYDYESTDATLLTPDLMEIGVVSMAVQRQPDTRIHCVLADGTVYVNVYDRSENVRCWVKVEMQEGLIKQVVVLPGTSVEDEVYYEVLLGSSYYLLKWAYESECQGGQLNKQADYFVSKNSGPATTMTGLAHLNTKSVVIWADGADRGTATVSGGSVNLGGLYTNVVVGLGYTARYKSTKLAHGATLGDQHTAALCMRKRVAQLGVVLKNTHYQGLRYGPDFTTMDNLPLVNEAATTAANTVHTVLDTDMIEFPGDWYTDSRLCLEAAAPRPCTLLAAVVAMDTEEGFKKSRRESQEG